MAYALPSLSACGAITSLSSLLGMGNFLVFAGAAEVLSCGALESQRPFGNS